MAWNLNSDRPIYAQILEIIQMRIVSGIYRPGERIPSVRELAAEAGVNPNTMQKALSELERSGLVIAVRTSGRVQELGLEMFERQFTGIRQCILHKNDKQAKDILALVMAKRAQLLKCEEESL